LNKRILPRPNETFDQILDRTECSIARQVFLDEILRLKLPAKRSSALIRNWQAWLADITAVQLAQNHHTKLTGELRRALARRAIVISSAECGAKRL
jgi:hypothetical protein